MNLQKFTGNQYCQSWGATGWVVGMQNELPGEVVEGSTSTIFKIHFAMLMDRKGSEGCGPNTGNCDQLTKRIGELVCIQTV